MNQFLVKVLSAVRPNSHDFGPLHLTLPEPVSARSPAAITVAALVLVSACAALGVAAALAGLPVG